MLAASLGQMCRHPLPLAEVRGNEPVDQLSDLPFDLRRCVADHPLFVSLLDAAAIEQVEHAADPERIVKVVLPAPLHLQQDLVDVGHAELEVPRQVFLIRGELALNFLEGREVVGEKGEAVANNYCVSLRQSGTDAERVEQLEMNAARRVEGRRNKVLERLEAAR